MDFRRPLTRRSQLAQSQSSLSRTRPRSSLSPFERLTSGVNIQSMLLPKFLRTENLQGLGKEKNNGQGVKKIYDLNEIFEVIQKCKSPCAKIVQVGKFELKKDDLNSVVNGIVSSVVIDAVFTIAKYLNDRRWKSGVDGRKVTIAKTKFSQKLFGSDIKANGFDGIHGDLMIFPIFVGYWTLLTFNSTEMIVNYYDPLNNCIYLKEILKNFYRHLSKQSHKIKPLAGKNLKNLVCQKIINTDSFTEEDSAIYMLKTVTCLCLHEETNLRSEEILKYRGELLILLFQYGKT